MMSENRHHGHDGEPLQRIVRFLHDSARRQAELVIEVEAGFFVRNRRYGASYDHNKLVLTQPIGGRQALDLAEVTHENAGCDHRLVVVDDDSVGGGLVDDFTRAGYDHQVNLIMHYRGRWPGPQSHVKVGEAEADEMYDVDRREWATSLPDAPEHVVHELASRRQAMLKAADQVSFLVIRDENNRIIARGDFMATGDVAQIEDVNTDERHRNRGLARAILTEGLRRAEHADSSTVFLVADANDWPQMFYTRMGFVTCGRGHVFRRVTH